jgi:hypothetical protein
MYDYRIAFNARTYAGGPKQTDIFVVSVLDTSIEDADKYRPVLMLHVNTSNPDNAEPRTIKISALAGSKVLDTKGAVTLHPYTTEDISDYRVSTGALASYVIERLPMLMSRVYCA